MIARLGRLPPAALRGGALRRRALLRRLQAPTASTRCQTLLAAEAAGAHCLVLCDTNGGTLPARARRDHPRRSSARCGDRRSASTSTTTPSARWPTRWPRCCEGVEQVQGTINGFGERCGNANLVSIIPNLDAQAGARRASRRRTCASCATSRASSRSWPTASRGRSQPYVGDSAFAHKGGMHVSAVLKHPRDLRARRSRGGGQPPPGAGLRAGRASRTSSGRPASTGSTSTRTRPDSRRILERLKALEDEGFQFEGAEASFELLMERALGQSPALLRARRPTGSSWRSRARREEPVAEATVRAAREGHPRAHRGGRQRAGQRARPRAAQGAGGVLPATSRRCRLLDYKVRILDESKGTAAKTRVLITSGDGRETWGTVGVADNIIEASWQALVDSVEYKLRADARRSSA